MSSKGWATAFFLGAVIFLLISMFQFFGTDSGDGWFWLILGALWLCMGAVRLNKWKNDHK